MTNAKPFRYKDDERYLLQLVLWDRKENEVVDITEHFCKDKDNAEQVFSRAWSVINDMWGSFLR
jgi:hypothetical protein